MTPIDFGVWLTGHDEDTVRKMFKDYTREKPERDYRADSLQKDETIERELLTRAWRLLDMVEPNAAITDEIFKHLKP